MIPALVVRSLAVAADGRGARALLTGAPRASSAAEAGQETLAQAFVVALHLDSEGCWQFECGPPQSCTLDSWPSLAELLARGNLVVWDAAPSALVTAGGGGGVGAAGLSEEDVRPYVAEEAADMDAHARRVLRASQPTSLEPVAQLPLGRILCTGPRSAAATMQIHICDDVDGAAFEIAAPHAAQDDSVMVARHVHTVPAFAYVLASKERRKFVAVASDGSLAVVAENVPHLFLYAPNTGSMAVYRAPEPESDSAEAVMGAGGGSDELLGLQFLEADAEGAGHCVALLTAKRGLLLISIPRELTG